MAGTITSASIHVEARANGLKTGRSTSGIISRNLQFTSGVLVNTADLAYYDERTIAYSSTPDDLDFAGGGLIDLNGESLTMAEMVGLVIAADEDNTVDLVVGGGSNPLDFGIGSNTISIKPGETKVLIGLRAADGYAVNAGSADNLRIAIASGVNQTYQIWALGRSA